MARLSTATPRGLDPVRRLTYAAARRMYGRLPEPAGVIAHHRPLLVGHWRFWRTSERFDQLDRLVLEYAEQMTRTPVEVSDQLFERLAEQFDERGLVELTLTIALENQYSRFNWALGIEGEGFSEGMYCVRAEHESATLVGEDMPR